MSPRVQRRCLTLLPFFIAACGGPASRHDANAPPQPLLHTPDPGAPDVPWSKKTHDQRVEYMGLYVFPKMRGLFRTWSPNAYKTFRCQTCHGVDMEAVRFKMPNHLYALPATGAEQAALAYDEKTARFMIDTVVPTMRELLGRNDPELAKAVGCHTCHRKE